MSTKTDPKDRLIYDTKIRRLVRKHYGEALVTGNFLNDLNNFVKRIVVKSLEHPDNQSKFVKTLCASDAPVVKRVRPPVSVEVEPVGTPGKQLTGVLQMSPKEPQNLVVSYTVHIQDTTLEGAYVVRTRVPVAELRDEKAIRHVKSQLANAGLSGWSDALVLVTDIQPYESVRI